MTEVAQARRTQRALLAARCAPILSALLACSSMATDPPPVPINFYPQDGLRPGQVTRVIVLPFPRTRPTTPTRWGASR
ncbi:MAG: hypothetical protein U1E76_24730 [Planctomycetota bacterium]